jgi:hypothetical protein
VNRRHLLWLLIPALGLAELGAHAYFSQRAPSVAEWGALKGPVAELRAADELVVVAPRWAEPLARQALGDELMPLAHVARPDVSPFRRAIEISAIGERSNELESWRVVETREHGDFVLRLRENPFPPKLTFSFVDRVGPEHASVSEGAPGSERDCPWNPSARSASGGLGGHPTFPGQRFECAGGGPHFVGVTEIDDEDYLARRCIWAHPTPHGPLSVRFENVPLGDRIYGYTGMPWVLARDGVGGTVELEIRIAGDGMGRALHPDFGAWVGFEIATDVHAGKNADVEFLVTSAVAQNRPFCFYADARWSSSPG